MNREKFHNELAMRLGYERIVNDKSIFISVEDSDDPWVTLSVQGHEELRFKASCKTECLNLEVLTETQKEIPEIISAVQQAFIVASTTRF